MSEDFEKYGFPEGKRYNSFVGYFKRKYGERLQKIVLDAGFTCPNRDGKVGRGGCTYCDNAAFHPSYSTAGKSLHQQMDEGIEFHKVRYRTTEHYLAYFQAYSNTYAPLERLKVLYEEALSHPQVVGIVIGTRPDCVDEEKLDYLAELARKHVVIVEYGIESCYDETLKRINRGHDFETARRAVRMTAERGIDVGVHFILGLPGETRQMMLDACGLINDLPIRSVKFHQLQIVKGTRMEQEYAEKKTGHMELLRCLLTQVLVKAVRASEMKMPTLHPATMAAAEYLREHMDQPLSLEKLSDRCGYAPQYISR